MYQLVKGVAHCHKHGVMHRYACVMVWQSPCADMTVVLVSVIP